MQEHKHDCQMNPRLICADWPAPKSVKAFCTTRIGGEGYEQALSHTDSKANSFQSFNLGDHVGDCPDAVQKKRQGLCTELGVSELQWLTQIHSSNVVELPLTSHPTHRTQPEADAAITSQKNTVCAVLTADCLPLLVCDEKGEQVAAIHAGWRGLAAGIVSKVIAEFNAPNDKLLCWMGPAIGASAFEVGADVYTAFQHLSAYQTCFQEHPSEKQKWYADIYALARLELLSVGVTSIYGGDFCTYRQSHAFYSYRRDGRTGRMASLIWRE